jgi:hypothetical protein
MSWLAAVFVSSFLPVASPQAGGTHPLQDHPPEGESPIERALIEEALERNPDVLAARSMVEEARSRPAQVTALPEPTLSVLYTNEGWTPSLGSNPFTTLGFLWSQDLPGKGKRSARAEVAGFDAALADAQLTRVRLGVASAVRRSYHELIHARELLALLHEQEVFLAAVSESARERYAVGQGTQADVLRVQAERIRLGQMRAEPDTIGVGDAHTSGHDVVGHPRELVDADDLQRDPCPPRAQPGGRQCVDRDGADNVLGYAPVNAVNVDGGADDNFYLKAGSAGIDRGFSWSYAVDADGLPRRDAAGAVNLGSADYLPTPLTQSLFAAAGQKMSLSLPLTSFSLPFSFPFYDSTQTNIYISPQGYIRVGNDFVSYTDNASLFSGNRIIAPLMDGNLAIDLTRDPADYLYADTSVANQVTIRWNVTNLLDNSDVQFSAVLFSDGRIRFDYGPGNTNLHPIVGISFGRQRASQVVSGYSGAPNLTNANSVEFPQGPGYIDLGAYEFRGNTADATPPTILGTLPAAVNAAGDTGGKVNAIKLIFSEDVNPIDAAAPAVYELRKAGSQGFGSADDVIYTPLPQYVPGSAIVTLGIGGLGGAGLPLGQYRLTVTSNTNTSVHDLAGLRLDGDANGSEDGDYVRIFTIVAPTNDLSVSQLVDNPAPFEGTTIHYTVTVNNVTPSGLTLTQTATQIDENGTVSDCWLRADDADPGAGKGPCDPCPVFSRGILNACCGGSSGPCCGASTGCCRATTGCPPCWPGLSCPPWPGC